MAEPANATVTAMWLWRTAGTGDIARFARDKGLTEVFTDPSTPNVAALVAALNQNRIAASCLGGDPQWTFDHDAAERWCDTNLRRARFTGLHLDVEPWALPQWHTDRAATARAYAALVERLAKRFRPLHVDIAPWLFDVEPAAATRVVNASDTITLLAYRDRASAILEFTKSARATMRRPYRIGVETQPVSLDIPAFTTFGDDGAAVLTREAGALVAALGNARNFHGVAVHHYASWRALRR